MRNFTLWRLLVSIVLTLPLAVGEMQAQEALSSLTVGKVYQFVNRANGLAMGAASYSEVKGVEADATDYSQLWYVVSVTEDKYILRNLGNGDYLKGNGQSALWSTVSSVSETEGLYLLVVGDTYNTLSLTNNTGGYDNAHYASSQGGCVVGWSTDAEATQWTANNIAMDAATLEANWTELEGYNVSAETLAGYQAALDNLFSDKACTVLKKSFSSEADLTADADYLALPAGLQAMARKVRSGSWEESNYGTGKAAWGSDYAKKFRVQLYEPYNEPEAAARALGINAHTNLNNPTGIFTDRAPLYIMVEGEIKEGASLYLASYAGHGKLGSYDNGTELHEGLNIVPFYVRDNNLCINYVVHTFDTTAGLGNTAKARRLSEYPDLKIHIEGGYINGYWNRVGDDLYKADTNDDWDYYEARATRKDLTVLGKYMVLQFPLNDADTEGNKGLGSYFNDLVKVEDVIAAWDNVMMWERLLMGLMSEATVNAANATWKSYYPDNDNPHAVYTYTGNDTDNYGSDYSDYYNVHGLAFGVNSGYMYGGWDHSGYNFDTMDGVIRDLPTNAGSQWGPAHEIGHQNQGPLTLRGETEVTNNLFSNMVLWYFGKTTSRVNGTEGSLETVLSEYNEGKPFCDYNIWALTHLYYKLFLYYHVLGNNTGFYPRLYEMLRQYPMNGMASEVDGANAMLRFYKFACEAAREDLTEFFRAYGFFVPLDHYAKEDYGTSYYTMTQEQVDAAIAEVKAKGYPENLAVLFINDYTGDATIIGSTGETLACYDTDGNGNPLVNAEMGSYASFGNATGESSTGTVEGTTMTVAGSTGGIGIVIRDAEGKIVAFSDKASFTVTPEVQEVLANGGSIQVRNADNTAVDVEYDETAVKRNLLGMIIAEAEAMVALQYEGNTRPGYYKSDCLTDLTAELERAKVVYDGSVAATYATAYDLLKEVVEEVKADPYAKVRIMPGTYYNLCNKAYSAKNMSINSENKVIGEDIAGTDAQKWMFEAAGEEGVYYIKNKSTGTYIGDLARSTQVSAAGTTQVSMYKVKDIGNGLFTLTCQSGENTEMLNCNSGTTVLGWHDTNDEGCHWYLTAVEIDATSQAKCELEEWINKTNGLLEEMGDDVVHARDNFSNSCLELQVTDAGASWYLSSNADQNTGGGSADGGGIAALVDGTVDTYFHSRWSGTAVNEAHYLQVDLGEGKTLSEFVFNYSTRKGASANNTSPAPTSIVVSGSNDGTTFTALATLTASDAVNPLPSYTALGVEWTSGLISSGEPYRYLRFTVTESRGPGSNFQYYDQYFFAMSEFNLLDPDALNVQVNSLQAEYEGKVDKAVYAAADAACCKGELVYASLTATQAQLQAAAEELKAKYEALLAASKRAALPVIVTTDAAHPVLYRIGIKRDNLLADPVLVYDESDEKKVGVARYEMGNEAQAWYFMDGSTVGNRVLIYPYYGGNTSRVLASNTFKQDAGTVAAVAKDTEGYVQDWMFTANAANEGYYNITCINTAGAMYYFSNHGGVAQKMGFYNNANDDGSLFTFERVDLDKSEAYCQLYNYYTYETRVKNANVTGSNKIGCYSEAVANAYNTAYAAAAQLLAADAAMDDDLTAAYNTLKAANEAMVINLPEAGKFYVVRSACSENNRSGALMYADGTNAMHFDASLNATMPKAVWMFEPVEGTTYGFHFRNLQTGCVFDEALANSNIYTLGEDEAVTLTLNPLNEDGQLNLTPAGANSLHAQVNGAAIVSWSEGVNSGSAWYVEEVAAADIAFDITVTVYGYAGLHLNYPVTIPDGLEAYIITTAVKDEGVAYLRRIEGRVIPANTGVILWSAEAEGKEGGQSYTLRYAAEGGALPATNLLYGSNYLRYVQAETDKDYYLFGVKTVGGVKKVGLYQAWEEYSADGTIADGNSGTDNGGYFRCQANKIYLPYDTSAQGLTGFTFRFDEEGTGLRPVVAGEEGEKVIYDLQGRRIARITAPGVYVVNGRKLVIKNMYNQEFK